MITKSKNVYYCEHCKKHGLSKHKMEYHEKICFFNPVNYRPCFNCKNLVKKGVEVDELDTNYLQIILRMYK